MSNSKAHPGKHALDHAAALRTSLTHMISLRSGLGTLTSAGIGSNPVVADSDSEPPTYPAIAVIGVSTGGPKALEEILPLFPHSLSIPILIVQHMPTGFTGPLAQRLNTLCSICVREATQHERIEPGVAYIAPAGSHIQVLRSLADGRVMFCLDSRPDDGMHVPSIDVLMKSVAELFHERTIGVIMTGMGSDGAEGMAAIFHEGGITIGQDQATSTVYSMPRACAERGVLTRVVPLSSIPAEIILATRKHIVA